MGTPLRPKYPSKREETRKGRKEAQEKKKAKIEIVKNREGDYVHACVSVPRFKKV